MRPRRLPTWTLLVTVLACPAVARGQSDGVCGFDFSPYYEQLRLVMNRFDAQRDGDAKTEGPDEYDDDQALTPHLETWYLASPLQPATGSMGAYRRLNRTTNTIKDFLDSTITNELGGRTPALMGYGWLDAAQAARTPPGGNTAGLVRIQRSVKGNDRLTWTSSAPRPSGYNLESAFLNRGYPRFGTPLGLFRVAGKDGKGGAGYGKVWLENSTVRVDFNHVWGNAIGRITFRPSNLQLVDETIGGMVQSVGWFSSKPPHEQNQNPPTLGDKDCSISNPTQSGSAMAEGTEYGRHRRWLGSPVVASTKAGSTGTPLSMTSVVRPFNFTNTGSTLGHARWPRTEQYLPLAWKGFIRRTDHLGCLIGGNLRQDVVVNQAEYALAPDAPVNSHIMHFQNTYWLKVNDVLALKQQDNSYRYGDLRLTCRNLRTGVTRDLTVLDAQGNHVFNHSDASCGSEPRAAGDPPPPDPHVVLIARADGSFGYGVAAFDLVPRQENLQASTHCLEPCHLNTWSAGAGFNFNRLPSAGELVTVRKGAWTVPVRSYFLVGSKAQMLARAEELLTDRDCLR